MSRSPGVHGVAGPPPRTIKATNEETRGIPHPAAQTADGRRETLVANKRTKGNITCVDCKAEGLKKWQVSPAVDLPGEQYRCGKCSVAHNTQPR